MNDLVFILAISIKSCIAVLLAATGEILAERSGVLNLGLEGMMLVGAVTGFAVGQYTGDGASAFAAAMGAAALLAALHALLVVNMGADQVISGLAVTIAGSGLSSFLGRPFIGRTGLRIGEIDPGFLQAVPLVGPVLAQLSVPALLAILLVPLVWLFLNRSAPGLSVRAAGEDPHAADAAGIPVAAVRWSCTLAGGCLAGAGGAYLSLVYTPGWKENMTAGQGWIAVAMVIFATWRPFGALMGALLFGALNALQFYFQATGQELVPAWVLRMLPYLMTVGVLFLSTTLGGRGGAGPPGGLGRPFFREG